MGTNDHYDKLITILEKPYFSNLRTIGLTMDYFDEIFERIFNEPVIIIYNDIIDGEISIFNKKGNLLYVEMDDICWKEWKYDQYGKVIYYKNSDGYRRIYKYDE